MTRVALETPAEMVEGHVVLENTEDGPQERIYRYAGITLGDVRYALNVGSGWSHQVAAMVARINALGTVDLTKWARLDDYDREEAEAYNLREECDRGEWSFGVPGTANYR